VANEDRRAGRSAAWGVVAALFGAGAFTTWPVAVAPKSTFPLLPTYIFAGIAAVALYMCFATMGGWWPTARSVTKDGARPGRRPRRRVLAIALACAILAIAGVAAFVLARSPPAYQGGGIWVHPAAPVAEWGDGPMVIEVKVTNISKVEHINFTGTWPGAGWEILPGCAETVAPPYPTGDVYQCKFDPQAAGVPALTNMTLSFDVYGTPANAPPFNLSPNGAHQVSWGRKCIYNPPASTCGGW